MTEKEKMLDSKPYFANGDELFAERQHAKEVLFEYNNLPPNEVEKRGSILRSLLGSAGMPFFIEPPFRCDYGYNIYIGKNFYANYNCIILDCCRVSIGDNVMFGPSVSLFTAGHPIHHLTRNSGLEYAFPITIGSNVWIGGGVIINPGVTIGENTVIGSGSVVTRDIPPNCIAAGKPCRVIRGITDEDKKYYFKNFMLI
jgi:maltose O-acetyltransferase